MNIKAYEQWKSMGEEIQDIRQLLSHFLSNPQYQKMIGSIRITRKLQKAVIAIDDYRSEAEDRMLKKVKVNGVEWKKVFYGKKAINDE